MYLVYRGKSMDIQTQDVQESLKLPPVLYRLFETVPETPPEKLGFYDPKTQTWSHREGILMSPVKHNQEH